MQQANLAISAIASALSLSLPAQATEARAFIGAGQCQYSEVGNYVWHNVDYEHALDMTSSCAQLSFTWVQPETQKGWQLGFVTLGQARANAVFPMRDEDQSARTLPTGENCEAATGFGCIGRGYSEQRATGVTLGRVWQKRGLGLDWGFETGLFVYEGDFRVHIPAEPPSNQGYLFFHWEGYQITPYAALEIRKDWFSVKLNGYGRVRAAKHGCGMCSGIANGEAWQVTLGVNKRF